MAKKVALLSAASALASSVLPLPGGPYSRMPRTGARRPVKMSARRLCQQGRGRGVRCMEALQDRKQGADAAASACVHKMYCFLLLLHPTLPSTE
jgi:hypothetical protein